MPVEYLAKFKHSVICRYEEGSIKNLGKELNVAQSHIYHWCYRMPRLIDADAPSPY